MKYFLKIKIIILSAAAVLFFMYSANDLSASEPYPEDVTSVNNATGPVNIVNGKGYGIVDVSLPDGFYTYANPKGPGTGMAIEVMLKNKSSRPARINPRYPSGERYNAPVEKNHVFIYKKGVRIPVAFIIENNKPPSLKLEVSLLICDDSICLPVKRELTVPLVYSSSVRAGAGFAALEEYLLLSDSVKVETVTGKIGNIHADKTGVDGITEMFKFEPQFPGSSMSGLIEAVIFGLIAGFILNFMPCVLPVVSLKIMAFVQNAGEDRRVIALQGLLFSAGIILSFLILAALAAYGGYSWGGLFQNQGFIVFMAAVIFALALSLFGVFSINPPSIAGTIAAKKRGIYSDAFIKGVIATLLATPCSGPFLGGTLAWAFNQPPSVIFTVFTSIGLGMALPYIAMSFRPGLVKIVPKPGNWMVYFETFMAFLLILTVVYLLGILDDYHRSGSILFFVFVAMGLWLFGRLGSFDKTKRERITAFFIFILISFTGYVVSFKYLYMPVELHDALHNNYSQDILLEKRDKGEVSVVVFTADWCPNCRLVEKMTLQRSSVKKVLADEKVNLLIADITLPGSEGEKLMHALGSRSIPFLAVFPPGQRFVNPLCLRDIYSSEDVISAVESAKKGVTE
jgi:thiol:disulfide interchange protein DsbD